MWARLIARVRAAWRWITDPPHLRPVYAVIYMITLSAGITTLTNPPMSIEGVAGTFLTTAWASCLIAGGSLGLLTVFTDWWWLERVGLFLAGVGGGGMYLLTVLLLHLSSETGSRSTQMHFIVLACLLYFVRSILIGGYTYAPRPQAVSAEEIAESLDGEGRGYAR